VFSLNYKQISNDCYIVSFLTPDFELKTLNCAIIRTVIIDFHTHIVPPRIKQARLEYAQSDRGFAAIFSGPKTKLATADDMVAAMDRDRVDVSVALNYGWQTKALCHEVNDYIMESVTRFPKRLVGFCMTTLDGSDASLKEVERCMKGGLRGVGEIRPDTQLGKGGVATIRPLAEFMVEHNLFLLTHTSEPVGHDYPGKGKATPELILSLITEFPELTIVCAHWGGGLPFYALMPEVKSALANVYFDTAASPFLYKPEIYTQAVGLVGAEKVLFGTDYPIIPARRYLKEIKTLGLEENNVEQILGKNAAGLLGFNPKI